MRLTCDTFGAMEDVTVRHLRNHGGEVIERVTGGETVRITRAGIPVAELRPLARPALSATVLVEQWRRLPPVDPDRLCADIDAVLDSSL